MKCLSFEQYAIVKEDSASLFTDRLNEKIFQFRENEPSVRFSESDPLCAYIHYTVKEETPETVAEASAVEGVNFVCAQCPYFEPILKDDETEDKRRRFGGCQFAELERTSKTAPACERLYELIKEGGVKLCFI